MPWRVSVIFMYTQGHWLIEDDRTMVWAIDLDDGTLIEALGKGIKRKKAQVSPPQRDVTCFGTGTLGKIKDEL